MIGRLRGAVASLGIDTAIIDVGGVGYEIHAGPRLLQQIGVGDDVTLSIETIVREDLIRLYGFENEEERACFRLLQTVQGVGAKHGLGILQVLTPAELYDAVSVEDITAVSRAHGVGKKLAQRIVTELQSKVGAIVSAGDKMTIAAKKTVASAPADSALAVRADAVSALANLGYDSVEARRAVAMVAEGGETLEVEDLIRSALKELAA